MVEERKEKKKEESRSQNVQLHAVISVAGVAAAVAAIAAATAAHHPPLEKMIKLPRLNGCCCVEATEAVGADRKHLISASSTAVNVRSHGDISRRLLVQFGTTTTIIIRRIVALVRDLCRKRIFWVNCLHVVENFSNEPAKVTRELSKSYTHSTHKNSGLIIKLKKIVLLSDASEDLHWKTVCVHIHRTGQVMLKMKSKHVM
ncbi:hypothetical protein ACH5RR_020199 [Cinchona calisaya]|uniref:Uncharacterized protein n=1 Tax=Cinchona calisaya TaxID=153742 RepID=A0ABD2ZDT2_9GENT